jgi:hypothetical protein
VLRFLITPNVVSSSPILNTLVIEVIRSPETSVITCVDNNFVNWVSVSTDLKIHTLNTNPHRLSKQSSFAAMQLPAMVQLLKGLKYICRKVPDAFPCCSDDLLVRL